MENSNSSQFGMDWPEMILTALFHSLPVKSGLEPSAEARAVWKMADSKTTPRKTDWVMISFMRFFRIAMVTCGLPQTEESPEDIKIEWRHSPSRMDFPMALFLRFMRMQQALYGLERTAAD